MNNHLFKQVVYITPNSLIIKIKRTKFDGLGGRSILISCYHIREFFGERQGK